MTITASWNALEDELRSHLLFILYWFVGLTRSFLVFKVSRTWTMVKFIAVNIIMNLIILFTLEDDAINSYYLNGSYVIVYYIFLIYASALMTTFGVYEYFDVEWFHTMGASQKVDVKTKKPKKRCAWDADSVCAVCFRGSALVFYWRLSTNNASYLIYFQNGFLICLICFDVYIVVMGSSSIPNVLIKFRTILFRMRNFLVAGLIFLAGFGKVTCLKL